MTQRFPWLSVLIYFMTCSCVTGGSYSKSLELSSRGKCEDAIAETSTSWMERAVQEGSSAVKTSSSYVVTGAAYSADVIVMVTSGVLVFGVMCGPTIIAGAGACWDPFGGKSLDLLSQPQLGAKTYEKTADWRLSDAVFLSQALRQASQCYEGRGTKDSLLRAYFQLGQLKKSDFFQSLPADERGFILGDHERVEKKLSSIDSEFAQDLWTQKDRYAASIKKEGDAIGEIFKTGTAKSRTWTFGPMQWRLIEIEISNRQTAETACQNIDTRFRWRLPFDYEVLAVLKSEKLNRETDLRVWVESEETPQINLKSGERLKSPDGQKAFLMCTR